VIEWSSAKGRLEGRMRIGFMSQVSPDGHYVVTRVNGLDSDRGPEAKGPDYYVANFTNYRFLQVFYPTRGFLAWYSRASGRLQPLAGADDPRYVQTSAFWSPDGRYLVFGRAEARDPYPEGAPLARFANDPNERQIQFSLYRIPFNAGRGGVAEAVRGASNNGYSNNFPKVTPDGRWIVYVRCRNGQLMRPDSELFIVPAEGGEPRRMNCNLPVMNSWHSFSPNGRWMVFSSKSWSPYTRMFLTHIDENGVDTPPIAIDNATEANRAVNIPEFVNTAPDGIRRIDVPAVDVYKAVDRATDLMMAGRYADAAVEWRQVVAVNRKDANAQLNLGLALAQTGHLEEAIAHYRRASELRRDFVQAETSLGSALAMTGRFDEAIGVLRKAVASNPNYASAYNNLGLALLQTGRVEEAIPQLQRATELTPPMSSAFSNLGSALAMRGRSEEARRAFQRAVELDPRNARAHFNLGLVLNELGRRAEAEREWTETLRLEPGYQPARDALKRP
jgi:Flp pilus assembly protein TadD